MIRLMTPLVVGILTVVVLLAITRMILMPAVWVSSLVAMICMPAVILVLIWRAKNEPNGNTPTTTSGRLRAALVGAGVALGTALLLSIADHLGLAQAFYDSEWHSLMALLPAVIAVAVDIFSARLEKKAEQDSNPK